MKQFYIKFPTNKQSKLTNRQLGVLK